MKTSTLTDIAGLAPALLLIVALCGTCGVSGVVGCNSQKLVEQVDDTIPAEADDPMPPFVEKAPRMSRILEEMNSHRSVRVDSLAFISECFSSTDEMTVGLGGNAYWRMWQLKLIDRDTLLDAIEEAPPAATGSIAELRATLYLMVAGNVPDEGGPDSSRLASKLQNLRDTELDDKTINPSEWALLEQAFRSSSIADLGVGGNAIVHKSGLSPDDTSRVLAMLDQAIQNSGRSTREYISYVRAVVLMRNVRGSYP